MKQPVAGFLFSISPNVLKDNKQINSCRFSDFVNVDLFALSVNETLILPNANAMFLILGFHLVFSDFDLRIPFWWRLSVEIVVVNTNDVLFFIKSSCSPEGLYDMETFRNVPIGIINGSPYQKQKNTSAKVNPTHVDTLNQPFQSHIDWVDWFIWFYSLKRMQHQVKQPHCVSKFRIVFQGHH